MSGQRRAPDTSVLIAGFDPGHEAHAEAVDALITVRDRGLLVAHTIAECYAVLTAGAFLAPPRGVRAFIAQFLSRSPVGIPAAELPEAVAELAERGVVGGSIYDGLIARAASDAGALLVSLDRRAAATYERCGADYAMLR